MSRHRVIVIGGGAAGFFAAITCAEVGADAKVVLLEKGANFLSKVRISGGGRCNVTHACFEPRELSSFYPRGGPALLGAFQRFQPRDTVEWFEARGVKLKTEADGRIFPVTDSSSTIIDCLLRAAREAGVELRSNCGVTQVRSTSETQFQVELEKGGTLSCDRLMLATGGCRSAAAGQLAVSLGHTLEPPAPSLFSFHVSAAWLRELAGISVEQVEVSVPELSLTDCGPLLLTHMGLSGPAILKLSAWGARTLHELNYQFRLRVNWLPRLNAEGIGKKLDLLRNSQGARLVVNSPIAPLAARLWEAIVLAAGLPRDTRWSALSRSARHQLTQQLTRTDLQVVGKTMNQEEFVTCGGVRLGEVNFKSMESRIRPGLFLGGELLDIDGLTGGFNFQSAWTTGWIAGKSMAIR